MSNETRSKGGIGNFQFVVSLLTILVVGYFLFQLVYPYYAFQSLEGTMEEWVKISVHRSDKDYTEMLEKIRWMIDHHKIPLDPNEIQIEYDRERKVLSVYAEYDAYVEFPGYTHHYHFEPYAEAEAG